MPARSLESWTLAQVQPVADLCPVDFIPPSLRSPSSAGGWSHATSGTHAAPSRPNSHSDDFREFATDTISASLANKIRQYVARCDPSIQGQNGSKTAMEFARKLVIGFNITPDAAVEFAVPWNDRCQPPWSMDELVRKLNEVTKLPGRRGFLLGRAIPRASKGGVAAPVATPAAAPVPSPATVPTGALPDVEDTPARVSPAQPGHPSQPASPADDGSSSPYLVNYRQSEIQDGQAVKIIKNPRPPLEILDEIIDHTGGWPKRVNGVLFTQSSSSGSVRWLEDPIQFSAWLREEFSYNGGMGMEWVGGPGMVTLAEMHATALAHVDEYLAVESYPHEPPLPRHYYTHPEIDPSKATGQALAKLISFFLPDTPEDEELIRAFFLTQVWGDRGGSKPMFLFESAELKNKPKKGDAAPKEKGRGAGKSTVPMVGAELTGGFIDINQNDSSEQVKKRLLTKEASHKRVVLIDNVKTHRFSDSGIEAMITSPVISGHMMYKGEASRPNTIIWVITANAASLSLDLAQRCIPIYVRRPIYSPDWKIEVNEFLDAHRWEVFTDIIAELRKEPALPEGFKFSRWALWEKHVLGKVCNVQQVADKIAERRASVDDDADTAAEVTDAIETKLREKNYDPATESVAIPSAILYEVVRALGKGKDQTTAMKWLYSLGMDRLQKIERRPFRGAVWKAESVPPGEEVTRFRKFSDGQYYGDPESESDVTGSGSGSGIED